MASITFSALRLAQTFNLATGAVTSLQSGTGEVVLALPGTQTTFSYQIAAQEAGELPIIASNDFSDIRLDGANALNALEAEIGTIAFDGLSIQVLILSLSSAANQQTDYIIRLGGDQLPSITTAAELNDIGGSATFSGISSGPFAPGQTIDLATVPGAAVTGGETGGGEPDIVGTPGPDLLESDRSGDVIDGKGGADTINGGAGRDEVNGGGGGNIISGGGGRDTLNGNGGRDQIDGNGGKDLINGGGGRDMVSGGGGKDTVMGGGGKDTIEGDRGADILTGGGGRDTFSFSQGDGRDRVTDYNDRADTILIGAGADSFADLTISQAGDDALIRFANVRIFLEDTDMNVLEQTDFMFSG